MMAWGYFILSARTTGVVRMISPMELNLMIKIFN